MKVIINTNKKYENIRISNIPKDARVAVFMHDKGGEIRSDAAVYNDIPTSEYILVSLKTDAIYTVRSRSDAGVHLDAIVAFKTQEEGTTLACAPIEDIRL